MCSQSLELQVVIPSGTRKKTADKKGRALKSVWCGRLVTLQPCKGCAAEKPCLACSLSGPITNHLVSRGCSLCLLQKKKKRHHRTEESELILNLIFFHSSVRKYLVAPLSESGRHM